MAIGKRNLARLAIGAVLTLALLVITALDGVDYTPVLRQPYYAQTMARLVSHCATNEVVEGELRAGFGRAVLTPISRSNGVQKVAANFSAVPLAGYGARKGRPATGVHDDVLVKAVALRVQNLVGVLVSADALIVPDEVTAMIAERANAELGLEREQIYLSATHTHSSLGGWGEGPVAEAFAGDFVPGVREWFADRAIDAIREALGDLKPAAFGHGRFVAGEFVRNRLVGESGAVDPEFSFMVLRQQGGVQAVLGSFAAHATVVPDEVIQFSGDYPGAWQRAVERTTGGMAVFLAGGMGSHSPVPGEGGLIGAERMGNTLAAMLLDELPAVSLTNRVTFGIAGVEVDLPPLAWRVTDGVRLRPWAARLLLRPPERAFVQGVRLANCVWLSTPCDFSGELTLPIKDMMRARGGDAVVTSFNGSYIGYVIPSRYYHLPGYEPRVMSFFGPNMPDFLDEVLRKIATNLYTGSP